jgi:hypothetical protein
LCKDDIAKSSVNFLGNNRKHNFRQLETGFFRSASSLTARQITEAAYSRPQRKNALLLSVNMVSIVKQKKWPKKYPYTFFSNDTAVLKASVSNKLSRLISASDVLCTLLGC